MQPDIPILLKNLWFPNYIPNLDLGCIVLGWKVISIDFFSNQIMVKQEETNKVKQVPRVFFGQKLLKSNEYIENLEKLGFHPQLSGSRIAVERLGD